MQGSRGAVLVKDCFHSQQDPDRVVTGLRFNHQLDFTVSWSQVQARQFDTKRLLVKRVHVDGQRSAYQKFGITTEQARCGTVYRLDTAKHIGNQMRFREELERVVLAFLSNC